MIDIKAESVIRDGDKGVEVSCATKGTGEEIVNEALTIIQSLMATLKKEMPALHLIVLKTLADNAHILLGEDEDSFASLMCEAMSKGIIRKDGLN